jgi:glycosyltransferase involved in cell wall biosynthesis
VHVWGKLVGELRRRSVDVLHAHKHGSNIWASLVRPLAGTPVLVTHEHTWSYEGKPVRRFLDRELIGRSSDAFVAVSREDRRRMIEIVGVNPDVIRFIPNGAPAAPPAKGTDVRAELGIPSDAFLVGAVGYLRPQKAFSVLIRAAAELAPSRPDLHVVMIGDGEERELLEALIAELGVGGQVHLPGRRGDIPDVLAALDLAVLSSDFEGSPLSVMEYMEASLPVVATRVGGVPDLVVEGEGETGLLVDKGDHAGLAAAIATLMDDPDRRRAMGERGRERRAAEFDLDVTVRRIEALYEELLARSGARAR